MSEHLILAVVPVWHGKGETDSQIKARFHSLCDRAKARIGRLSKGREKSLKEDFERFGRACDDLEDAQAQLRAALAVVRSAWDAGGSAVTFVHVGCYAIMVARAPSHDADVESPYDSIRLLQQVGIL